MLQRAELITAIKHAARSRGASLYREGDPKRAAFTEREAQVYELLIPDATYCVIGAELDIGVETVRTHVANIRDKLLRERLKDFGSR